MNKRSSRVLLLLATLLLTSGFATTASAADRNYTASISPTSVGAGNTDLYTVTITNDASTSNNQLIREAKIQVPPGFTVDSGTFLVYPPGSKSCGHTWDSINEIITLTCNGNNGLDETPSESVMVTFYADAPCEADDYEWTTTANQDANTIPGTPFTLLGDQPSVEVTGTCEPPADIEAGDFCSYTQGGWGAKPQGGNPGSILAGDFSTVYPTGLQVGDTFTMSFAAASNVAAYLPGSGPAGALTANLVNPTSSPSGVFGGQVTALRINVDFNDAGIIWGYALTSIGDLVLQNTGTSLDSHTVAYALAAAEQALGSGSLPPGFTSIAELNVLVDHLNNAFDNCGLSDWAVDHLTYPED